MLKDVLDRFGESSVKVAELLKEGHALTKQEQMFLENQLLIVQLALTMSKHKAEKRRHPAEGR